MSTTANINLSSQALTARLKRAGLRCEAGSMYEGGFSCRQYRDRAGGPVKQVNVYFSRGHGMPNADAALLLASVVLADAGYEVEIITPNRQFFHKSYLTVTRPEEDAS
jgi:hypothetical protein